MGQAVKELVSEGKLEREDLVLSTKIFFGYKNPRGPNDKGLSRKHIIEGTKVWLCSHHCPSARTLCWLKGCSLLLYSLLRLVRTCSCRHK